MTREELEQEIDAGKHDEAYWEFVVDKGAGQIPLHEDAIFSAIEDGRYFDAFADHLEETLCKS